MTILHWCCQFPCIRQLWSWYGQFIIWKKTFVIITKSYSLLKMLQRMASWLFRCTSLWTPSIEFHVINLYFYRMLTWSSNMGGTAPGSGTTSATCLALTEVLSEENVNLFNNSALKCEHEWVVEHFDIFDTTNKICSNKINTWNLCQLQSSPPCEQFLCATWGHLQARKSSQSVQLWSHQIQICNIFIKYFASEELW